VLRSIRSRLWALVIATIIPFTVLIGAGIWIRWRSDQATAITQAISEARRGGAPMSSEIARQVVATFQEPAPVGAQDEGLSRREQEILDHLLRGFANKDIASRLSISVFTVKNHLRHIYEKLHVRSRTDVLLKYRDTRGDIDGKVSSR